MFLYFWDIRVYHNHQSRTRKRVLDSFWGCGRRIGKGLPWEGSCVFATFSFRKGGSFLGYQFPAVQASVRNKNKDINHEEKDARGSLEKGLPSCSVHQDGARLSALYEDTAVENRGDEEVMKMKSDGEVMDT